jgi:integrase
VGELLDRWLEKKSHEVEFRTIESYRDQARLYLRPRFGNRIAYQLTTAEVQAAIDDWQKADRLDKKFGKRSARTISYPITVLSSVLKYGKALGVCRDNVAEYVQRPRKEHRLPPVVDAEHAVAILRALLNTVLFAPIWVAFCAGLRRGEIVALRRGDVGLDKGTLNVERSVVCRSGRVFVKVTKRPKSERALPMSEITKRILVHHLQEQERRLSLIGVSCTINTPLFDDGEGGLWHPDTFGSTYAREFSKSDTRLRLHGARHSFASIALEEGVQLLVISDVLGHESKAFTAQHYAHVLPNTLKDAMNRVSDALERHLDLAALPHMTSTPSG